METERYTANSDPYLHLSAADGVVWVHNKSDRIVLDLRADGVPLAERLRPGASVRFVGPLKVIQREDGEVVGWSEYVFTFAVTAPRRRHWWSRLLALPPQT